MPTAHRLPVSRTLVVAAMILVASVLAAAAAQSAVPTGLRVVGSATVYGEPDIAVLTLGVDVTAPRVTTALAHADQVMQAVRKALLDGGVEAKDLRTVAFNVWREDIRDSHGTVTGERYHVAHSYQITVRDLSQLGALVAAGVEAGANNVQGIRFSSSDPQALEARARAAAMRDAEAKARQLAGLAGVTLGNPVSIEESASPVASPAPVMAAARAGGAVPVEAGQLAVQAQVTVRFAIR